MSASELNVTSHNSCRTIIKAVSDFLQKLRETDWLSQNSKVEIKGCLQSAKRVENILEKLNERDSREVFLALLPNLHGLHSNQLQKICDTVLSMILIATGVSFPCVQTCIKEYLQLCGSKRFQEALADVIFSSEIYRVLLDYITSSETGLDSIKHNFQSEIFCQIWKSETDTSKLKEVFYNWIKEDTTGQSIFIALQVLNLEDSSGTTSCCLVSSLSQILKEREETAVLLWKIIFSHAESRAALERSSELLKNVLEFLKVTAQWMEATTTFTWISGEKGPCKVIGFGELVSSLDTLMNTHGPVARSTELFMEQRRQNEGCTLWDDVQMKLNLQY